MRLPTKTMVIAACCGSVDPSHPVLPAIGGLARLHRSRLAAEPVDLPGIDCARAVLMRDVDRWVAVNCPQRPAAAYLHTESLGSVVDRMAGTRARAWQLLSVASAADPLVHSAWTRLAELTDAYHDLVSEVESGRRRLPLAPPWDIGDARSHCW
jgi:hypothetical protein